MQLVPPERRSEQIPCRHTPFDVSGSGETRDSLYRCSEQNEIEETVGSWLKTTIRRLEEERAAVRPAGGRDVRGIGVHTFGSALDLQILTTYK